VRIGAVLTIAASAATVAATVAAAGAGARTTATKAIVFHAFTASGAPGLRITSTARGSCNGGSAAIDRADAWRCFAGNFVYDPCFSAPHPKGVVLCPTEPWEKTAAEIKLSGRLTDGNRGNPSTRVTPWAVETDSGLRCRLATGATTILDNRRANYFCGRSKTILWGKPSRKSEPWTIYAAPENAKRLTKKVGLSVAWF
jgi:hypothetical protein